MQLRQFVWSCAGGFLLVMASAATAADTPPDMTASPAPEATAAPADATAAAPADATVAPSADAAATSQPQVASEPPADTRMTTAPAKPAQKTAMAAPMAPPVVSDPGKVYLIKENPFFSLHIDKAIQHARDAEIAGNMGQTEELLEHAKMSLMRAREAQRAGNVSGLNEGIANLKKALLLPVALAKPPAQPSPSVAKATNPQCIDELERQCGDVEPGSGRIQKCFDDKMANFSPMCQEQLKGNKAEIAAALTQDRQQRELAAEPREANAVNEATNFVREARKNLSQAAGTKYVEIKPQPMVAVSNEK